jgi:hypothetical protein
MDDVAHFLREKLWNLYTIIHDPEDWQKLPSNTPPLHIVFPEMQEELEEYIFLLSFKDKVVRSFPVDLS